MFKSHKCILYELTSVITNEQVDMSQVTIHFILFVFLSSFADFEDELQKFRDLNHGGALGAATTVARLTIF